LILEILEFSDIESYKLWDKKMEKKFNLPIFSKRASDGEIQPQKQKTTRYSNPIENSNKGDRRIISRIDSRAEKKNTKIIDEEEAKIQGWLKDDDEKVD